MDHSISWSSLEYEAKEKSQDWYWAFGIIVITATIAAIIFNNYFFAGLILLAGGLLWFLSKRDPEMVTCNLGPKGLQINDRLYLYANIKAFYLQKEPKYLLFVKTDRPFLPIMSMPIEPELLEVVKNVFKSKKVAEEEMREHPGERILDSLGF